MNRQQKADNRRINLYRIIRYGLVILLIVMIILFSGNRESKTPFDRMAASVSGHIQSDSMKQDELRYLKKYYGLNADDYEGVLIYTPATNMSACEALLIKLKSADQSDDVEAAIQSRIASQDQIFRGYAPEQVELLEQAVVDVQGNYVFYIVDDNAAQIDEVFRSGL